MMHAALRRKNYRKNEVIEENKALLKTKYKAAKALGQQVSCMAASWPPTRCGEGLRPAQRQRSAEQLHTESLATGSCWCQPPAGPGYA